MIAKTDDFDFVFDDTASSPRDRAVFLTLDGEERADRWLDSSEEVANDTDPWDPDHDDGLTDGQEVYGLTKDTARLFDYGPYLKEDPANSSYTDPTDPDHDQDGYWDGWIGVYGVGRTENVVLYREQLRDNDASDEVIDGDRIRGVRNEETVDSQSGVHKVAGTTPGGALEGSNARVHSNVHIGELQWVADPSASGATPSPSLSIEVDYYAKANHSSINTASWESAIEQNYALYGIKVDLKRDEIVQSADLPHSVLLEDGLQVRVGSDQDELTDIYEYYGEDQSPSRGEYLFIAKRLQGFLSEDVYGTNPYNPTIAIYMTELQEKAENVSTPIADSPYENKLALVSAKTTLHEIGHSFDIDEADNDCTSSETEVYSGSYLDCTPEFILEEKERTLMAGGYEREMLDGENDGDYFIFSLEELMSVNYAK